MEDSKEINIIPFSAVTKFHGHVCPGSAIGYRAAEIAMKELASTRSIDEEFLAILENDSCSVDAIQVVTGCTFGKGNLIIKDYGKQTYNFVNRKTGEALRLSLKKTIDEMDPEFNQIREKAFSKSANEEDKADFETKKNELSKNILEIPAHELIKKEKIEIEIPEKARLFQSVKCSKCGEIVAEHRAQVKKGNFICIPCFEESTGK